MSLFSKTVTMTLAAVALGAASLVSAAAEASPRGHGIRHGGHGGHLRAHGIARHHIHRGHWHHRRHWGVYPVYGVAYAEPGCRLVERVNRYGYVVTRRICSIY